MSKMTHATQQSGFTLLELILAVSIGMIIILGTVSLNVEVAKSFKKSQSGSALSTDLAALSDYFVTVGQNIGGSRVRSWAAAWSEDNCAARGPYPACGQSDRLTVVDVIRPIQECDIQQISGAVATATTPAGVCCLTNAMSGQQMAFIKGVYVAHVYAASVNTASCQVTFAPGQAAFANTAAPPANDWSNGTLTVTQVRTFYLDTATTELRVATDRNNNGTLDTGERLTLTDRVYDFQIGLGFDFRPNDGLTDDSKGANDEVLFNQSGEQLGQGAFLNVSRVSLHSLQIGFIVGAPLLEGIPGQRAATILNGPERKLNNWSLHSGLVRVVPRNTFFY